MSVSVICSCKNRSKALKISLMSWLSFDIIEEIIIVDWNSDESLEYFVEFDSRIRVIRVDNEIYFNQPQPLNIALQMATKDYILKLDCDHVLNPYYNFFETYKLQNGRFVCGQLLNVVQEHDQFDFMKLSREEIKRYVHAYSPYYKFLIGMLYVKREDILNVGGYNEILQDYYAFEDEEIYTRLELYGLEKDRIEFDNNIFHVPHPDSKRTENFKGHVTNKEYLDIIKENLSGEYQGQELDWQSEYALTVAHVQTNKKHIGDIKDYKVNRLNNWKIEEIGERCYMATRIGSKLENFPTVNYISLEESEERRKNLESQFQKYGVNNFNPLISKRFSECNDIVTGSQVNFLDDGTKGCVASHLKMIKRWYDESDEDYGFFCEDDLNLESVQYWNFTWEEFIENIPEDAQCVQLYCIRDQQRPVKFENRWQTDWSVTAYILTKKYAKVLLDQYYVSENEFNLEVYDTGWYPMPENVLFWNPEKVYCVNLFLEDLNLESTFTKTCDDIKDGIKNYHLETYNHTLNWWKNNSINSLNLIFENKKDLNDMQIETLENQEEYKEVEIILDIEELLKEYAVDTENPELNFRIGLWYEYNQQDAAALSFFIRSAERSEDKNYAYESLIHGAYCYDRQGTRDMTVKGILQQALCLLPERPEAYYHLSNFCRKRCQWQDSYIYANTGLMLPDKNYSTLRTDVHYPGKVGFLLEKSLSGWFWGKIEESYEILEDLSNNYDLPPEIENEVIENLKKYDKVEWYYTDDYKDILTNIQNRKFENLSDLNDIGKIDIVLQGPVYPFTHEIIESYLELDFVNNVILSTWEDQEIPSIDSDRVFIVANEIPTTPGTDKRNLQIITSKEGINLVKTKYSAKMRTDQKYDLESMKNMYEYVLHNREYEDQIFVAGVYPGLLFHPRDHIFWGRTEDLKELFNIPLEYDGLCDKMAITKEELYKYYSFFVRTETYIGARYCSKFDERIKVMLLEPEKYLHDDCGGWNQSFNISQKVTPRAFKPFPRTGIDFEWKSKNLSSYPYNHQKNGYGECWAEDL